VRGKMKLAAGASFRTTARFPGVLPALPKVAAPDAAKIVGYLKEEAARKPAPFADTYADGKWLGRLAALIPLAEEYGEEPTAKALHDRLCGRLERWFTAADAGSVKDRGLFHYNARWGTLIGYPASFWTDTELNDHHFHYGYFL